VHALHPDSAQINDPALSPVAAAPLDNLASTTGLKARPKAVSADILTRVRTEGLVTPDLADGDLVPVMCGIAYAAKAHGGDNDAITANAHRYLALFLAGIRA
jgi:hypothetical protein